jgi:hypothetical protein
MLSVIAILETPPQSLELVRLPNLFSVLIWTLTAVSEETSDSRVNSMSRSASRLVNWTNWRSQWDLPYLAFANAAPVRRTIFVTLQGLIATTGFCA